MIRFMRKTRCNCCFRWSIAWAPYDPELEKVMNDAFSHTPNMKRKSSGMKSKRNNGIKFIFFLLSVESFVSGDKMEERLNQDFAMKKFLVGVRFENIKPNSTLPKSTIVSSVKTVVYVYIFYTA